MLLEINVTPLKSVMHYACIMLFRRVCILIYRYLQKHSTSSECIVHCSVMHYIYSVAVSEHACGYNWKVLMDSEALVLVASVQLLHLHV